MDCKAAGQMTFVKINLSGGAVSVGYLDGLLQALADAGIVDVRFGARQQLYFDVSEAQLEELEYVLLNQELTYEVGQDAYPNIVSSYVADGIFTDAAWIREGVYKDILDSFDFAPRLKVNLMDSTQSFTPYSTGNLNFLTAEMGNYWFLHIRFPGTNIFYRWSTLVYSDDIAGLCKFLEAPLLQTVVDIPQAGEELGRRMERLAADSGEFHFHSLSQPFIEQLFKLPYYEGFNAYQDRLWLGVYRRSETFTVAFLKDICTICIRNRVGQVYTTPWKSIIIKDILPGDRSEWDAILDKHRINLRHALNELNWQTEDYNLDGIMLKHQLVGELNALDVRTYKLCFGIKIHGKTGVWGSVILRYLSGAGERSWYQIQRTSDFNPNSKDLIVYRDRVKRADLCSELIGLCDEFYIFQELSRPRANEDVAPVVVDEEGEAVVIYQCQRCLTRYDPSWGDLTQAVPAGVPFADLPAGYICSVCGAARNSFRLLTRS